MFCFPPKTGINQSALQSNPPFRAQIIVGPVESRRWEKREILDKILFNGSSKSPFKHVKLVVLKIFFLLLLIGVKTLHGGRGGGDKTVFKP